MYGWTPNEFQARVYNDDYVFVDPDYLDKRPLANAAFLTRLFGVFTARHIDYGGGNGLLSRLLGEAGWMSSSFDPFVGHDQVADLSQFDLITAFEVFEHVPDVNQLMSDLKSLSNPSAIILFSTLLSDGHIHAHKRLDWWYASPRNGHISLFSRQSLNVLAAKYDLNVGSFSNGTHVFFTREIPHWARHIFNKTKYLVPHLTG